MSGILASTKNNMQVFKKARCLWNENSKFLDRFKMKTFFFREHHDFGKKIEKSEIDLK